MKHALIIGIGNYPSNGGWSVLSSLRDIQYIDTSLKRQGFSDIRILKDEEATKLAIENAFNKLTNDIKQNSGDIVVIHISAHGEQIEDDNNEETDGLDECVATYNSISPVAYRNANFSFADAAKEYIRDDELGELLDKLRSKTGKEGDIILFMDNCHSGSGTRGLSKVRGDQPPLVSSSFKIAGHQSTPEQTFFQNKETNQGGNMGSFVVISAAGAGEPDHETEGDDDIYVGSLTYAISKAFERLDAGITYRSLFARIQSVMNIKVPGQHPVIEGNGVDRIILGGEFVEQKPYFEISSVKDSVLIIKGGLLSGLNVNAIVSIYPQGTIDPGKATPVSTGIVTGVTNYASQVKLNNKKIVRPGNGWVFLTAPAFYSKPLSIKFDPAVNNGEGLSFSNEEITRIKQGLSEVNVIYSGVPVLIIRKGNTNDSIIVAGNGYTYKTIKRNTVNYYQEFAIAVQSFIQYIFLQDFSPVGNSHVEVKLIPVTKGKADTTNRDSFMQNGRYEFYEKDTLLLRITNTGKEGLFVNILDMQPDGVINPVLPNKKKKIYPEDLYIKAGESKIFWKNPIVIYPPYGTEIFKVFVSADMIDMESIATSAGRETRSIIKGIERIVKKSYVLGRRGQQADEEETVDGYCFNLLFQIRKK